MRKQKTPAMVLVLCCATALVLEGCSRPIDQKPATLPTTARSAASRLVSAGTATTRTETEPAPIKMASLRDLKLTLPEGWKADYDRVAMQWKVEKNVPFDAPFVLIRSLLPNQEPKGLIDFWHRLE